MFFQSGECSSRGLLCDCENFMDLRLKLKLCWLFVVHDAAAVWSGGGGGSVVTQWPGPAPA